MSLTENYSFILKKKPNKAIKKSFMQAKKSYLNRVRLSIAIFYFVKGLSFATWASRIPDIKTSLHLTDSDLGSILFALPVGQLIAMPFSGKLVERYGSYIVTIISTFLYCLCMTNLGLATQTWHLTLGLFLFGISGNVCNISINTQGVYTNQLFEKPIMGSLHGSWSIAGFFGALIAIGMISVKMIPYHHFLIMGVFITLLMLLNYKYLVKVKSKPKVTTNKKRFAFTKPDSSLLWLGAISFCSMASEGIMFDWSGVYFKDIVKAPGELVVLGYTSFMVTMAIGRFLSDVLVAKYGPKKLLVASGILISSGLYIAVFLPYIVTCTIAFMFVGFGVSNVIPVIFSLAGKNTSVPTSTAITIVSSISFLGFLMGPPVIGFIANASSLQYSFAFIGIFGFLIAFLIKNLKRTDVE